MSGRELLMKSLSGEETDRIPIWLLFPYHRLGCYVDVQNLPGYREVFEASRKFAVMLNRRVLSAGPFSPEVKSEHFREEDGNTVKSGQVMEWKNVRLRSETVRDGDTTTVRKLVSNETELEAFCSLPVNTDPGDIIPVLEDQLPNYLKEKSEFPGEYGAMMLCNGEPIGTLYGSSELTEYPIWSITHSECIQDFLDRQMQRLRIVYTWCLEHDLADVYFLVGSELASPPMVSRETFQKWIVPYAKEITEMIQSYGKKVIVHYHGQIKEILPDFLDIGPDGLHTIEAPPVGNCTFSEAYDVTGDSMTLIGNIQYDCFRSYSAEEMADAVRDVIDECRGRRFMLSPTAGPFDPELSENMKQNYMSFMETGFSYGKFRSEKCRVTSPK